MRHGYRPAGANTTRISQVEAASARLILLQERLADSKHCVSCAFVLGALAGLSVLLLLWQWCVALLFPLRKPWQIHASQSHTAVTLLKPVKGVEANTETCLRSWFEQSFEGPVQILFGVSSEADPACRLVNRLLAEHPHVDASLIVCGQASGANAKVSKLCVLEKLAKHPLVVISDADVLAPTRCVAELASLLEAPQVGLANCFYRFANPSTPAMRWEAAAVNVDFWSQVLQSCSLKRMDFALGAVMATRKANLQEIGGFEALRDHLADDYQLGHRIANRGHRIALARTVVECFSAPATWSSVWKHQVRWARTIRVSQPLPYFMSILSNPTLWTLLWALSCPVLYVGATAVGILALRVAMAANLDKRLGTIETFAPLYILVKDVAQAVVWAAAFLGSTVEWRGETYRLRRDGTIYR